MKSGGTLRISVPDGEIYARHYASGERMPFEDKEVALDPDWTPMQSINQLFYGHGHRHIYDFATLKIFIEAAGFAAVKKVDFGSGRDPILQIDQESRRCESLYVEATKP